METNTSYSSPHIFSPFRISKLRFGPTRLWIESSLTSGLSAALHIQISCILCRGGGLHCWGMHVKRHRRPLNSRLLIHCHIMDHLGKKEAEKNYACIINYYLPRNDWNSSVAVDKAHPPPMNAFLICMARWAKMCHYLVWCPQGPR